jgi:peptidoglycan/LPS O-acetylase OafA/YrhL
MVDAWRGLAALGVVCYHLGLELGSEFDLGHICVMAFFVISGYCIAASTDSCRRNNIGARGYMWRRVRRIYPPYFFSICFFAATRLVKMGAGMGKQLSTSVVAWIQNLTMTQWLSLVLHPARHPFDNRTLFVAGFWSLNYEEQFYLVMGLLMFGAIYFRISMLPVIVGVMIPAFVWNLTHPLISYGFFWEYWVAFGLGSLVFYRLCKIRNRSGCLAIDFSIVLLLAFSLYRYHASTTWSYRWLYTEWIVTSTFALILIYLRSWDVMFRNSKLGVILGAFGVTSYSLYLTHQFNLRSSSIVASRFIRWGLPQFSEFFIRLAFCCAVGAVFWYFCERPFLNKPPFDRSPAALDLRPESRNKSAALRNSDPTTCGRGSEAPAVSK